MFATGHVLKISACGTVAAIRFKDHINGQKRTYRAAADDFDYVLSEGKRGFNQSNTMTTSEGGNEELANSLVGVSVAAYKDLRPLWFVTEDELMEKYQLAQRDQKVDIHPELLTHAKRIWGERLRKLSDGVKDTERMQKPSIMCQSSEAEDHEGR